jgi:hypothetical protein
MKYFVTFEITRPRTQQYLVEEWFETEAEADAFVAKLIEEKAAPQLGSAKGYSYSIKEKQNNVLVEIAFDENE